MCPVVCHIPELTDSAGTHLVGLFQDGDGDPDVFVTGRYYSDESHSHVRVTELYRNDTETFNIAPTMPSGLTAQYSATSTTFSWDHASDVETPFSGLTYNLRIGTTPGEQTIRLVDSSGQAGVSMLDDDGCRG